MGLFKGLFGKKKDTFVPSTAEPEYDYLEATMAPDVGEVISEPAKPEPKFTSCVVAGVQHYLDNLMSIAHDNPEYNYSKKELLEDRIMVDGDHERIYEYEFYPHCIKLIPEPDNEFDKNAIKVVIDDYHVGYIKKGSCSKVKKLLANNKIEKITAEIYGGKYKLLMCDVDDYSDKETYTIEKDSTDYKIKLTIKHL